MRRKLFTSLTLASLMILNPMSPALLFVHAQSQTVVSQGEDLVGKLNLPGGNRKVSLSVSNENIRTVLHNLAQQGGFNLVMDDSVTDPVSVELHNVTINEAVRSVAMMGNLKVLPQAGNIFLVISSQAAQDKGLNRSFSKSIP